jgi:hypothetical protein
MMQYNQVLIQYCCKFCGMLWHQVRERLGSTTSVLDDYASCPHCASGETEPVPNPKPLRELFPAE